MGDWGIETRPNETELQIADRAALDQAERFLRVLAEGLPRRWLFELRAFSAQLDKRVFRRWLPLSAITAAARWCRAQAAELDVYVGVQPRCVHGGGAAAVAALVTLYADLDCGPGKRMPDKTAAMCQLERLAGLGLRPAMVIDSGNGLHAYWPLREPLAPGDGRAAWQDAMRAVAGALHADPSVTDLPRILRVPGTFNWKEPANAKPVRLLELDTKRRFTLLDFDDLFPVHHVEPIARATSIPTTSASPRVTAAIRAAGWRVREKRDHGGKLVALVLDEPCPFCPGAPRQADAPRRGTAHIGPRSGALRCKRALCAAGVEATGQGDDGEARGLSFECWAARFVPAPNGRPGTGVMNSVALPRVARLPGLPRLPR